MYVLDLKLGEVLAGLGIPATFYVPRRCDHPTLGADGIRSLLDMGCEIGAHTLDHGDITKCRESEAVAQIQGGKDWVESITGIPCPMMCFPGGRFRRRDLRLAAAAKFVGVRSVELLSTSFPVRQGGILVMATSAQAVRHRPIELIRNLVSRARWSRLFRMVGPVADAVDWRRTTHLLADQVLKNGGVLHVWGHSWEIEKQGLWSDLSDLMRELADLFPPATRATNGEICRTATRQAQTESA